MSKFFVTLFIDNSFCQYRLDDIIQNSSNGYIREDFVLGNKSVYFPILVQNDSYSIVNKSSAWTIKHDNNVIHDRQSLNHGDYYVISDEKTTYAALIVDYDSLSFSGKAYSLNNNNIFLGRSSDMNIILDVNANVSRKHAAIHSSSQGNYMIEDLSGKTGIYVNRKKVTSQELSPGDEIFIMGTTIIYYPNMLIVPSNIKTNGLVVNDEFEIINPTNDSKDDVYVRTPRILKSKDDGKIVIDAPTTPQKAKDIPFILSVGPSMTMSLAMLASLGVTISNALNDGQFASLITSGVMTVSMLAGAILWPSLLRKYNKRQEEANEKYRQDRYNSYLLGKEHEISGKYERNSRILTENIMPSPKDLVSFVSDRNRRLWERVPTDEDFLNIRLGIGEADFEVEIESPKKGFVLEDDKLVDNAIALANKYRTLVNVPISISLADKRVVGVVGEYSDIANTIITNIVSLHSYDEVKLVLIYNSQNSSKMKWASNLPHVWSNDKKIRYVATNKAETMSLLQMIDEYISNRESSLGKDDKRLPHFVFLVMDEKLVEDVPFRKNLVDAENAIGISTVFFGRKFNNIPKECTAIIQKDSDVCGMYVKNENNNQFIRFDADSVSPETVSILSNSINSIKVKTETSISSVPDRVTFLDMYKVGNIEALEILNHWSTNTSDKSLAAPIGVKAGGDTFLLDIHEKHHGCHGLVAGTTGSGKSEFLQAYILSMMINYSPNEVAFVLVDFKGGDMARPFLKSPHLAATISNLSGNTLHRALISLEAEVKSRQNMFNEAAAKLGIDKIDINSYHKYFKDKKLSTPLPHLIIVIDEFAQLKTQHPEFMSKLIDVAQVGRSLGIHLILATQRPSGVVDPQIWSNSRFKVCLKVLDKQDSMDMINRTEAALIKQPGRAYVQVGYDEIFEQIQSGYSGADYIPQNEYVDDESVTVKLVNWPAEQIRTAKKSIGSGKTERTQLEEAVTVLVNAGEIQGVKTKQLWLPPLPLTLKLEECFGHAFDFNIEHWDREKLTGVTCGLADLPDVQKQEAYSVDFLKNGHLAIYGSSGCGKSTLIQTIMFGYAQKYSPELFNLFVLDFDGGSLGSLTTMPHCVEYSSGDDENQVESIMNKIQSIITERRELFAEVHCANYESYIMNATGKLPLIVIALDNYAAFREKMYRSEDQLVQIISAARSCGVFVVVTGNSKGAIYYKITEQISSKIVLNMNDSGSYRDILNVSVPIEPANAKGRALTVIDKKAVEVQFAVPFDCDNESNRTRQIQNLYEIMAENSVRPVYSTTDTLSQDTSDTEVRKVEAATKPLKPTLPIEPLRDTYNSLLVGNDLSSKAAIGFDLHDNKNIFVCNRENQALVNAMINHLAENTDKQIYLISSHEEYDLNDSIEVVYELDAFIQDVASNVSVSNIVLCIDGFSDFFDRISDEALSAFERALKVGVSYSIITFDDMERINDYRDTGLYISLVRADHGIVVGGSVDDSLSASLANSIYEINKIQREKALSGEQAFVFSSGKCSYVDVLGGKKNG